MINIDVLISEEVSGVLTVETDDISDYAVKVCRAAGSSHADINIVFIGDEKMTVLNETYSSPEILLSEKTKRGTTDVLSFNLSEASSELLEGEVYVSLDKAKIQAKVSSTGKDSTGKDSTGKDSSGKDYTPFEKEVVMLVTHGLLHLTGRIHDTPESYKAMVEETEKMIAMYWGRKEEEGNSFT